MPWQVRQANQQMMPPTNVGGMNETLKTSLTSRSIRMFQPG